MHTYQNTFFKNIKYLLILLGVGDLETLYYLVNLKRIKICSC